ncbi:hypothetical protein BHE74_00003363 [Ensete ventricosum]|nr:hypothetical protein BHE74_00003363 [Ensete ventricosum]
MVAFPKDDERNSMSTNVNAKQLGAQASTHIGVDRLEQCILGREGRPEAMLSNDENFIRHLHRGGTLASFRYRYLMVAKVPQ